jgi:hypothetical protein
VVDVIPDEHERSRCTSLGLLLRTASGRVHPRAAYLGWLHHADLKDLSG